MGSFFVQHLEVLDKFDELNLMANYDPYVVVYP